MLSCALQGPINIVHISQDPPQSGAMLSQAGHQVSQCHCNITSLGASRQPCHVAYCRSRSVVRPQAIRRSLEPREDHDGVTLPAVRAQHGRLCDSFDLVHSLMTLHVNDRKRAASSCVCDSRATQNESGFAHCLPLLMLGAEGTATLDDRPRRTVTALHDPKRCAACRTHCGF